MAAVLLVFAGCSRDDSAAANRVATGADAKSVDTFFPIKVGETPLRVQVVVTLDEQTRGLMGRAALAPDEGMIFVYPMPQQMSFWMRNTSIPLDIGFFREDGTLGEVHPMYPFDETPVRSSALDYTVALEVNQGWFAQHGLKPGAKLDLAQVAAALRARGFAPERYGVRLE